MNTAFISNSLSVIYQVKKECKERQSFPSLNLAQCSEILAVHNKIVTNLWVLINHKKETNKQLDMILFDLIQNLSE